jgi:hypothetical protein
MVAFMPVISRFRGAEAFIGHDTFLPQDIAI